MIFIRTTCRATAPTAPSVYKYRARISLLALSTIKLVIAFLLLVDAPSSRICATQHLFARTTF